MLLDQFRPTLCAGYMGSFDSENILTGIKCSRDCHDTWQALAATLKTSSANAVRCLTPGAALSWQVDARDTRLHVSLRLMMIGRYANTRPRPSQMFSQLKAQAKYASWHASMASMPSMSTIIASSMLCSRTEYVQILLRGA